MRVYTRYQDYALVFNEVAATKARQQRYTLDSLKGIISDIILLSETDYLVCTFSSQVMTVRKLVIIIIY